MKTRPASLALALVAAAWGAAGPTWLQVRTPHFVVFCDGSDKQARQAADQMERTRLVFQRLFPKLQEDSGAPTTMLAVRDQKEFDALEPAGYVGKGQIERSGFFLWGQEKNHILFRLDPDENQPHPYAVIYHEYTHSLLRGAVNLPVWLNEGLAEFYQNTDIGKTEATVGEPDADNIRLLRDAHVGEIPLPTLFAVGYDSPYYHEDNKATMFYAEAWALTHYFIMSDAKSGAHRLGDYMALCAQGVEPVAAASQAFGDLGKLQAALDLYMRQLNFQALRVTLAGAPDASAYEEIQVSQATVDAERAEVLARGQRFDDARALLQSVLAAEPSNSAALEAMGTVELEQDHREAAAGWYAKAVKLDSQSLLANYYYGSMTMRPGLDADTAALVETSLRKAIQLDPHFAPAYDRLAIDLEMQGKNLEEAHGLELQAVTLEPGEFVYRYNTANLLVSMQRYDDALAVLGNAQATTKTAADKAELEHMRSQLQSYVAESNAVSTGAQPPRMEAPVGATLLGLPDAPPPARMPGDDMTESTIMTRGTITALQCAGTEMNLTLKVGDDVYVLHAADYHSVTFTADNYTPASPITPCSGLPGMRARVVTRGQPDTKAAVPLVSVFLIQ